MTTPATLDPVDSLVELIERFRTEDKCHEYMEQIRWPSGPACPRCGGMTISRIKKRRQYDCDDCRYQFSIRVGTVLHDSKLPLWKWFLAVYLMGQSKKGISAAQLGRTLGVSYKTAWYLSHRVRAAMAQVEIDKLAGTVEVDETYVGGKKRGRNKGIGSQSPFKHKTMILGAVERGGNVHMELGRSVDKEALHEFVDRVTDDDTDRIYTDGAAGYKGLGDDDTIHETVSHWNEEWVRGDVHTNTVESVWSLLKRSVIGSYHQLSVKHLPAYLGEIAFRYNNRRNPFLFRDTIRALCSSEQLGYENLTKH